jgi:hypothetical protein
MSFDRFRNWLFKPVEQPAGLISLLLNEENPDDRFDAAHDLGGYDQEEAEHTLAKVALDPHTDDFLADACGESLGEIWCRKGRVNYEVLKQLDGPALRLAVGMVKKFKPDWEGEFRHRLRNDPARTSEWDKA